MNALTPIPRPDSLGRAQYPHVVAEAANELRETARLENYAADRLAFAVLAQILRRDRPHMADLIDACSNVLLPVSQISEADLSSAEAALEELVPSAAYAEREASDEMARVRMAR